MTAALSPSFPSSAGLGTHLFEKLQLCAPKQPIKIRQPIEREARDWQQDQTISIDFSSIYY
jgi:hypothetical protein